MRPDADLVVDIQSQPPQLSRLSGPVGRQVRRKRRDLVAAAAAHDVTNLRVFGSVARGEDRPDSDVDLLVDLPPDIGLLGLGGSRPNWRPSSAPRSTWCQPAISSPPSARAPNVTSWHCDLPGRQRLADIQAAIDAVRSHLLRGDLSDGLVFDAVRIRLLEIGEAVKAHHPKERACSVLRSTGGQMESGSAPPCPAGSSRV